MSGEVLIPMFVGQNFNRSFSEFSFNAKQDNAEFKYRSYSKFYFYTNASGWVRKLIFNKVVKKFDADNPLKLFD